MEFYSFLFVEIASRQNQIGGEGGGSILTCSFTPDANHTHGEADTKQISPEHVEVAFFLHGQFDGFAINVRH